MLPPTLFFSSSSSSSSSSPPSSSSSSPPSSSSSSSPSSSLSSSSLLSVARWCLAVVDMLLRELRPQRRNLRLQRRNLLIVLLLHPRHTRFNLAHVLPHIHVGAHDLAHAASTAPLARHAARLRQAARCRHRLVLQQARPLAVLRARLAHASQTSQRRKLRSIARVGRQQRRRRAASCSDPTTTSTASIVLQVHLLRHVGRPRVAPLMGPQPIVVLLARRNGLGALRHASLGIRTRLVCIVERRDTRRR